MKKTLSLLLAIALCLSLSVLFTACGHEHTFSTDWSKDDTHHWHACTGKDCTEIADKAEHSYGESNTCVCGAVKPIVYTVDGDTAWAEALELGTNWTIHAVASSGNLVGAESLAQRNGNKFVKTDINGSSYEAVEDNNCYTYRPKSNSSYTKTNVTQNYTSVDYFMAQWSQPYIPTALFGTRTDFTYNEDTQKYEAASLGAATNVWLSFADGKLLAVGYESSNGSQTMTITITVTYGDAGEITLPINYYE
ncbi:MAG: hypothetical protein IJY22_02500 [Clostridia bacterium]|nr:hypothetical protein [Clostridia bacterium]